jgi:hypothetical protein
MKKEQGLHDMFAENLYSIGFKALKPLPLILQKMLEGTKHLRYSKVKDQLRHSLAPTNPAWNLSTLTNLNTKVLVIPKEVFCIVCIPNVFHIVFFFRC